MKLKSLFSRKPKARKWSQDRSGLPWSDHPGAIEELDARVASGKITAQDEPHVRKFIEDGYCVVGDCYDPATIDAVNAELDGLWETDVVNPNITFNEVYMKAGEDPVQTVKHEEIVRLPKEERLAIRGRGKWRTHGYHHHSPEARKLFDNKRLGDLVSTILGTPTQPLFSINFTWGSRHGAHQDLMVFHVHPANYLIGAWIAMEDVGPDCGPLVYWPGSHREPIYSEYDNYPQTNLRTSDQARRDRYEAQLAEIAKKYERKVFLAKKGEVLLWHAMLLHGGDAIKDTSLTRRSFVIHYVPEKMNKAEEVVGPFMW